MAEHVDQAGFLTNLLCSAIGIGATNVVRYCLERAAVVDDFVLRAVISNFERSEPAYLILVESKRIDVNYGIDRMGTVIGFAAARDRHNLVRFLLERVAPKMISWSRRDALVSSQ
jgi:hypothetical protein